ncbi:MAG: hypothetical protein ABI779_02785 [Acidobacteriota bacterium]
MEIIVTVAIVGIVALVTIPALMQLMPQYRIRSAAGETAANIRMIRQQAMAQRIPWRINFDLTKNRYRYSRLIRSGADLSVAANWQPMRRNPRWPAVVGDDEEWVQVTAVQLSTSANSFKDVVCPTATAPTVEVDLIFLRDGAVSNLGACSSPTTLLVFAPPPPTLPPPNDPELKFAVDSTLVNFNRYFISTKQNGTVNVRGGKE